MKSSGEEYDRTTSMEVVHKGKPAAKTKRKRVVPQELETQPIKRPRRKNATVSLLYTPQPVDDDEVVSSSTELSSYKAQRPKADATPIDRKDPLIVLTTSLVPIIERYGNPSMHEIFKLWLSCLRGGNIRRVLYPERQVTTTETDEIPEFAEHFRNYSFV